LKKGYKFMLKEPCHGTQEYVSGFKIKWATINGCQILNLKYAHTKHEISWFRKRIVFNTTFKISQSKPFKIIPKQRKYFSLRDQIPHWQIYYYYYYYYFFKN
jgi:hypothetical protein